MQLLIIHIKPTSYYTKLPIKPSLTFFISLTHSALSPLREAFSQHPDSFELEAQAQRAVVVGVSEAEAVVQDVVQVQVRAGEVPGQARMQGKMQMPPSSSGSTPSGVGGGKSNGPGSGGAGGREDRRKNPSSHTQPSLKHVGCLKGALVRAQNSLFCTTTLSSLPFNADVEPLLLVYYVNRHVTVR
jgi:hypothetical protein